MAKSDKSVDSDLPPGVADALGTVRVLGVSVGKFYYYAHYIYIFYEQCIHIFEVIYKTLDKQIVKQKKVKLFNFKNCN